MGTKVILSFREPVARTISHFLLRQRYGLIRNNDRWQNVTLEQKVTNDKDEIITDIEYIYFSKCKTNLYVLAL